MLQNPLIRAHALACAAVFAIGVVAALPAKAGDLKGFSVGSAGGLAGSHAVNGSSFGQALGANSSGSTAYLDGNNGNTTGWSTGSASGNSSGQRALANGMHMGMAMGALTDQPFTPRDIMANSYFALPSVNFIIPGF